MEIRNNWFDFHGALAPGPVVAQGVADGLVPFQPRKIELYMDYDIDYNQYRIHATAIFQGGFRLTHSVQNVERDFLLNCPEMIAEEIGNTFFLAFRHRESCQPPTNIVLGEN